MNGIHDMGGMDGFGAVRTEPNEPVFHDRWEGRVFGMTLFAGSANIDAFRFAIESLDPRTYLDAGYYGRWLLALERRLVELGLIGPDEVTARCEDRRADAPTGGVPEPPGAGALRPIDRLPRFRVGDSVVARNANPRGHTRLPRYARGKRGTVALVHPGWVFPDTNAHGRGENPEYAYAVRFSAAELWGEDAEENESVTVDLFESYLLPAVRAADGHSDE